MPGTSDKMFRAFSIPYDFRKSKLAHPAEGNEKQNASHTFGKMP